ncbi:MAG: M14 family metallopeptidase [Planctomycetia bacterium]|jgi:hypothetical protein
MPCSADTLDTKAVEDTGAIVGYETYVQFANHLKQLAKSSPLVRLESLAKTSGSPDAKKIFLVTVGHPDPKQADKNRAVLVLGSVEPNRPLGSELCVRMIDYFTETAKDNKNGGPLLSKTTFYIIPRPTPDAYEAFFQKPYQERTTNNRPVDDDHDGHTDEDGPDDLNGDGWVTLMRVEDPRGDYVPHSKDPRVMVRANTRNHQRGRYRLFIEGIDNDHDGRFNEDPLGGVEFNRNFPFNYDFFGRGAGPHQVSEPETRAVADFAFDHPNIAAVFSFSSYDNLMRPWQPDSRKERERIKTRILGNDASYLRRIIAEYSKITRQKDVPAPNTEKGAFVPWAYFHFGRPSLSTRGWAIPGLQQEPVTIHQHIGDQLQALRWFKEKKIDGFVAWTKVDHPDFPGQTVEVGGFKPFLQTTPPAKELGKLAHAHGRYLAVLSNSFAKLKVERVETEPLDGGLYRVTAVITNEGWLPTELEMGGISRQTYPIQVELLDAPKETEFIKGSRRTKIHRLGPMGGNAKVTWLIRIPSSDKKETPKFRVKAWSPSVGKACSK